MMRTNYTYAEFMHKLESKSLVHTAKRMHAAMSVTNCTQSEHILNSWWKSSGEQMVLGNGRSQVVMGQYPDGWMKGVYW